MEVEKASSKSSGFFKIFDWGKKPKRKLFAGSPTSDKITDGKDAVDNVSSSRSNVVDDDDGANMASNRGTSECSCSITEEEGIIIKRPPGVVARLMGLDSIPIPTQPDPLSSPPLNSLLHKRDESVIKPHKMPSSPIERFQTEMIPNKLGRMVPVTRYKPLSPIKRSNFVSGRNAAQIMEVASRIIEPGLNLSPKFTQKQRVYNSKIVNRKLDLIDAKGKRKSNVPVNQNQNQNQNRINMLRRDGITNSSRIYNQKRSTQNISGTKNGARRLVNGDIIISSTGDNINNNINTSLGRNPNLNPNRISNQLKGSRDSKNAKKSIPRSTRKLNTISEANNNVTRTNNNILVRRSERHINNNSLTAETQMKSTASSKKFGTNGINTSNIVSFTFTSPVDKLHNHNTRGMKTDITRMGVIDGDYLGVLLEQKLRELTCGDESPYKRSLNVNKICESEIFGSVKDETGVVLRENECLISGGEYANNAIKETDRDKEPSSSEKEPDQINNLGPFLSLEALPSTESCNSSESLESSKGTKSCTSFRFNEVLEVENEPSPSESDYSLTTTNDLTSSDTFADISSTNLDIPELALLKDILTSINITEIYCNGCLRFDESEKEYEEERFVKTNRKMLIGCVHEFLEAKFAYFFRSGYKLWSQGLLYVKQLSAERLFREIWVEKGVDEEGMVDVLVDADMSVQLGKWVNFETECFEIGAEVGSEVLNSLIDELVVDLRTFRG